MMNDYKFNKLLSDTITLPILPANKFTNTDTEYYAVLEKNYIPITSTITCIYKPDWITEYKFTIEDKYYNRLSITSINDNTEKKLRKGIMEFTVSNDLNSVSPVNHIYAKVSQAPYEKVDVHLEFIPTDQQKIDGLNKQEKDEKDKDIIIVGGSITGDEQEIHLKYYGILNERNQSNAILTIDGKSLDQSKIKSLRINTSDNSVELIYLIDENTDPTKNITFTVTFKTQYNTATVSRSITQLQNKYNISLTINNKDNVVYTGDKRILFYSCNINGKKEIQSDVNLEFTYITNENELKYVIQNTTYTNKQFNTIINIEKNYTTENRKVKVKVVYNINDNKKIESNEIIITQDYANIIIQYYLEYLDRGTKTDKTSEGTYKIEPFGETVRIHYYGLVNNDKITSVTNTKNGIINTYNLFAYEKSNNAQFTSILNNDEYIFDITFLRNEEYTKSKLIFMRFIGLQINDANCTLSQDALSITLEINKNRSTSEIGGIPQFNDIKLIFRAYDNTKNETVEDVNLYTIIADNSLVNLSDIQYEIITYNNITYVVASNIRSKDIYFNKDKSSRNLQFTIKYNNLQQDIFWTVKQNSVIYGCEIKATSNVVSSMGDDNLQVKCIGIINDNYTVNKLETYTDKQYLLNSKNGKENIDTPTYVKIQKTVKDLNYSSVYLNVYASNGEERTFYIKSIYKNVEAIYEIKQLALCVCIELYTDEDYLYKIDYENKDDKGKKIIISPFIDNYIYFKCYLYEVNYNEDGTYKYVNIDVIGKDHDIKLGIQEKYDNIIPNSVRPTINLNNIIYTNDYIYQGVLYIPKFIYADEIQYEIIYKQDYYTYKDNTNKEIPMSLQKVVSIYKPNVYTINSHGKKYNINSKICCIQYKTDSSSNTVNDNTEILKFDDVSNEKKSYVLYYRVVYAFDSTIGFYIYNVSQYGDTYIDTDKLHFIKYSYSKIDNKHSLLNWQIIKINEVVDNNKQKFLKSTFDILENTTLKNKGIKFDILYQYNDYNISTNFNKTELDETNHLEIIQKHGIIKCKYYFDDNNDGKITDKDKHIIVYTPMPYDNAQYFYFNITINDNIIELNINNFIVDNLDNNIDITSPIIVDNTRRSSYSFEKIYTENTDKTYNIFYQYKDYDGTATDETKYGPLTIIRQSFATNNDSKLYIKINNANRVNVSNSGETVTISFWIEYKDVPVDLGSAARGHFQLYYNNGTDSEINIKLENENISYKDCIYSFKYDINPNNNTDNKTYKFKVTFGNKLPVNNYVSAIQSGSSYGLIAKASNDNKELEPLNPSNVTISCNVIKDNNREEVYTNGIKQENFSITIDNDQVTEVSNSISYQGGNYSKEYKFNDNKDADPKTYTFTCKYSNLFGHDLIATIEVTQKGAEFEVDIKDSETDESKENIVNPVGCSKIINYWGTLNKKNVTDDVLLINDTTSDGLNFVSEDSDYGVKIDTLNKTLSRKFNFKLNTTPNTITYKFTAKYQGKTKSIEFTQIPGQITLVLKNNPNPIPKTGGNCTIIYYAYAGDDPNSNHITDNITLNESKEVDGFISYTPTKVSGPTITNNQIEYVFSVPARKEDNDIDKLFKRNWSITYKNGDVEKNMDIDIIQNGDTTFFPAFDIFGLKYQWEGGHDLDTVTLLTRSDGGTLLVNGKTDSDEKVDLCTLTMGWKQLIKDTYNMDEPCLQYINYSGDNTSDCGYESVAINFRKILLEFELNKVNIDLNFDIWMTWFSGNIWDGKVNIYFETFKGDDISFDTNSYGDINFNITPFNPAICRIYKIVGTLTSENHNEIMKQTLVKAKGGETNAKDFKNKYAKVGQLKYNTKTKTAILTVNNKSIGADIDKLNYYKNHIKISVTLLKNPYVDHKYSAITTYSLILINNTVNNIDNVIKVQLEGFYRSEAKENASISLYSFTYVNSSIQQIYVYIQDVPDSSSGIKKSKLLPSSYYTNINSSIYSAQNTNQKTITYPAINLDDISDKIPTTDGTDTFYGIKNMVISYNYKYTVPGDTTATTLSILRTIQFN